MSPVTGTRAGEPSVLDVTVSANANGTYAFQVTIFHKDEGWQHYADAFDIMIADGTSVGTRVLYHPHVDEQPFTRSLFSACKFPSASPRSLLSRAIPCTAKAHARSP